MVRLRSCASSSPVSRSELNDAVRAGPGVEVARNPDSSVYGGPGEMIEHGTQSFCDIHSAGCALSTVAVSLGEIVIVNVALCSRASAGSWLTSQCTAPLNAPPQEKNVELHCCVLLVWLRLPWSRAWIVIESSGVPGSSVRNDCTLPSRRSCV